MPRHRIARIALFASALVAGLAGCSAADTTAEGTDDMVSACGTALGDEVRRAADNGKSTVKGPIASTANRVVAGPLIGGQAIIDEMVDMIRQAKREVMLEFYEFEYTSYMAGRLKTALAELPPEVEIYIVRNPNIGQRLFGALPEKPEDGVKNMQDFLQNPRVKVAVWSQVSAPFHLLDMMHSKQVVVDGERALVTDANVQHAADPLDDKGGKGWYQLGIVVEGEVASQLRAEVVNTFSKSSPKLDIPPLEMPVRVDACTPMVVLGRAAGAGEDASANQGIATLFRAAKHRVNVLTPNLNDDAALDALADATEDADVQLILPKNFNEKAESYPGQGGGNEKNIGRLVKAAKNRCHLHVRWFAHPNGMPTEGNEPGANHAKWASADGAVMILGSQNLDTQSWKKSQEVGVAIDDAATTGAFDDEFGRLWDRAAVAYEANDCVDGEPPVR